MENNLPNTVAKLDLLLAGNNHFSRAMWIILFNKTIILFASVGYEIFLIANATLRTSLAIYHPISDIYSRNNF